MKLLETPTYSTELFSYNRETKEFFQEMSSLTIPTGGGLKLGPVYDDALDQGFTLFNPKTGVSVKMVEDETIVHDEEVVGWLFVPAEKKHKGEFTLKIIND